uniref:Uncharacterized protein n=1 Tax=Acrobeloides nanus TaxID=290746 RepID=A0A914D7Z6_9BILA
MKLLFFTRGLKPEIRVEVMRKSPTTYDEALKAARKEEGIQTQVGIGSNLVQQELLRKTYEMNEKLDKQGPYNAYIAPPLVLIEEIKGGFIFEERDLTSNEIECMIEGAKALDGGAFITILSDDVGNEGNISKEEHHQRRESKEEESSPEIEEVSAEMEELEEEVNTTEVSATTVETTIAPSFQ